jgi:hypothetical protein
MGVPVNIFCGDVNILISASTFAYGRIFLTCRHFDWLVHDVVMSRRCKLAVMMVQ